MVSPMNSPTRARSAARVVVVRRELTVEAGRRVGGVADELAALDIDDEVARRGLLGGRVVGRDDPAAVERGDLAQSGEQRLLVDGSTVVEALDEEQSGQPAVHRVLVRRV